MVDVPPVEASPNEVPSSVVAFARRLSPRARAALPCWEWEVRLEQRFPREELQRRLAERGIPEWPFLWPLEEAFAGVRVRMGGEDLSFGITAGLPHVEGKRLLDEHGEIRFAPIAEWGNDILLVDATGGVYVLTELGVVTAVEPSFEGFLENQAMSTSFAEWSSTLFSAHFSPKTAVPAVAASLGVPAVAEVSNEFHRWWQNDAQTLYAGNDAETPAALWAKTLGGLVEAIDAAAGLCDGLTVRPIPSYEEPNVEVLDVESIRARAPGVETLAALPGARRFELMGEPSLYEGKPPSTGDVWISGEGESLRVDVLERREGAVVNYWQLTPSGSHALLMSWYGKG